MINVIYSLSLVSMLPTVVICVILATITFLIIRYLIKCKKSGKSSCGCGCSGCGMQGECGKNKDNK